jgi:hypothetical protein
MIFVRQLIQQNGCLGGSFAVRNKNFLAGGTATDTPPFQFTSMEHARPMRFFPASLSFAGHRQPPAQIDLVEYRAPRRRERKRRVQSATSSVEKRGGLISNREMQSP